MVGEFICGGVGITELSTAPIYSICGGVVINELSTAVIYCTAKMREITHDAQLFVLLVFAIELNNNPEKHVNNFVHY